MSTVESTTTVLEKIRTRGYWSVVIRPATFDDERVPYTDLLSIIERNFVRLRGWDYPYVDRKKPPLPGTDWVGQEHDLGHRIEVWRLYTSGLFAQHFAMVSDWEDCSIFHDVEASWKWGQELYYLDTIHRFVEIFEFAARLAQSAAGDGQMHVEVAIKNLKGRRLVSANPDFPINRCYTTERVDWLRPWIGTQTELMARSRELAADATREFFIQFGLNLSMDELRRLQGEIGR